MILEAIVTTSDAAGVVNVAPMGPEVADEACSRFTLKPFHTSRTYANLRDTGVAVIHISDDVELLTAAATGTVDGEGLVEPLLGRWVKLIDCCRWFAVEVESWSDDALRPRAECRVSHHGEQRPMFGFNRGKHAVLEAAILTTRLHLLGQAEVRRQMQELYPLVEKTGGLAERRAWRRLELTVDDE